MKPDSLTLEFRKKSSTAITLCEARLTCGGQLIGQVADAARKKQKPEAKAMSFRKVVRAFSVLILRYVASDRKEATLCGGGGSLAQSLYDPVRRKVGESHVWYEELFARKEHPTWARPLQPSEVGGEYHVSLNRGLWQDVEIKLLLDGVPLRPQEAAAWAALLEGTSPAGIDEEGGVEALDAEVQLEVYTDDLRSYQPVGFPGTLPLLQGHYVRLEVWLSAPAHVLVLWLTSEGQWQPLYPWTSPSSWSELGDLGPKTHVSCPPGKDQGFGVNTASGLETVLVMAREKAISRAELKGIAARLPKSPLVELRALPLEVTPYAGKGSDEDAPFPEKGVSEGAGGTRLGPASTPPIFQAQALERDHPLRRFQEKVAEELQPDFPVLRMLSVPNQASV
ncbi:MAG: hypothetical protein AAF191_07050 [Verrucomicrobiota bacterium]